jgi:5'-nucleotidase
MDDGRSPTRTLITNDDGIDSPGIRVLARAAREAGLDVVIAAPSWDSSGSAASLTAVEENGRFLVESRTLDGMPDIPAYAVEGAPAFIVRAGVRGAFGPPPDLVLSGINLGVNTGYAVLHSGTVGAVLTAATQRCRGMAVSLVVGDPLHWDTAGALAQRLVPWLLDTEPGTVLNLNVPNLPLAEVRGLQRARLSATGTVQANVTELGKGYVQLAYTEVDEDGEPGTDTALLHDGFACFTPLMGPCEAAAVDTSAIRHETLV